MVGRASISMTSTRGPRWRRGVKLSINTDAHSTTSLQRKATLGISVARRAGATADEVINTFTIAALKKFIALKR